MVQMVREVDRGDRWWQNQSWNQSLTRLSDPSESRTDATLGAFTTTSWRNAKMSPKPAVILYVAFQNLTKTKRNEFLNLLQNFEDLFDGTLGTRKTDPAEFEIKED